MTNTTDAGPAWKSYVIQGTVAEDATAGTHVCSLTVTPGAGNEMQVLFGMVQVGNTATAQTAFGQVTDGTNVLSFIFNGDQTAATTAFLRYPFPSPVSGAVSTAKNLTAGPNPFIVSGTMSLVLTVSTAAISVTQTFAVVVRVRGIVAVTFADTVGTPTITTNTSQVF